MGYIVSWRPTPRRGYYVDRDITEYVIREHFRHAPVTSDDSTLTAFSRINDSTDSKGQRR